MTNIGYFRENDENTTIVIKRKTLKRLYMLKKVGETCDELLNKLVDGEVT